MNEQASLPTRSRSGANATGQQPEQQRAAFLPSFALLVVAYTVAAAGSLKWAAISGAASPLWPAAGIAIACILNAGPRVWPGIVLATVVATQLTGAPHSLLAQFQMGFGNALAAVAASEVLTRFGQPRLSSFASIRSVLLLLAAALVAGAIASLNGALALLLLDGLAPSSAARVLETWFYGDLVGVLVVSALIMSWRRGWRPMIRPAPLLHLLIICTVVSLLAAYAFFAPASPRAWAIYPALAWAAIALRVPGASASLVVAIIIAAAGTVSGLGPFGSGPDGAPDWTQFQQYLAVTAATTLLLAAAVQERNAELRLREAVAGELAAREAAFETQQRLSLALEASGTGMWEWDLKTGRAAWSPEVYPIMGLQSGEFDETAETFSALIHPDDRAHAWAAANEGLKRKQSVAFEYRIVRPDGDVRWVINRGKGIYDADGNAIRMIGTVTDITEKKRADEQLARLADRAEIAQQAARSSLYEYDPATGVVSRDPLVRELAGYSFEDLPDDHVSWERVVHPEDLPQFRDTVSKAMERAERFAMEYRVCCKDGSTMWVSDVGRIIRDDAGIAVRVVGMSTDITERKEAEEELRRTSSMLRLIGDSAGGLIFAKDRQGRYLYYNSQVAVVTGHGPDQLLGKDDRAWASTDLAEQFMANDRRIMDAGVAEEVDEEVLGPDGGRYLYRAIKAPLRDADGNVIGIVGVAADITHRKATEEREQLLAREVDHRAKNLLAVVQSVVQMSRADDIEAFKAGVIGRIQSLARAHTLLADSRWEGVEMTQLVRDELAPFESESAGRISIDGPPIRLSPAASQSLALVLHELATNAAKYGSLSNEHGQLVVRWSRPRRRNAPVRLEWREENGPPSAPPTRSGFGSRLIQASVERQLGGDLAYHWSESGLAVQLLIPADHLLPPTGDHHRAADSDLAGAQVPPTEGQPTGNRVLIVEDEALIGLQLEQVMESAGFEVTAVVASVEEALQALDDSRPDGALLDINLGGEKSFPIADRLNELGVPFGFCTGYAVDTLIPERFSGVPVLRKPFEARHVAGLFAVHNSAV